jgi:hypothetical protein
MAKHSQAPKAHDTSYLKIYLTASIIFSCPRSKSLPVDQD